MYRGELNLCSFHNAFPQNICKRNMIVGNSLWWNLLEKSSEDFIDILWELVFYDVVWPWITDFTNLHFVCMAHMREFGSFSLDLLYRWSYNYCITIILILILIDSNRGQTACKSSNILRCSQKVSTFFKLPFVFALIFRNFDRENISLVTHWFIMAYFRNVRNRISIFQYII